jgi:DNA-binding response OmpR family regulator
MRVLIVEDDRALAAALADALRGRAVAADLVHDAASAEDSLAVADYTAILLDLGLPDEDGLALLRRIRARGDHRAVIVLTARGEIRARVAGLDAGADDYLTKPFDVDELHARLTAVLRRQGGYLGRELACANLRVDAASHAAFVGDEPLVLSQREMELLELLLRRSGRVITRRLAEDQLFGLDGGVESNAVEVYVHRLRRRLEKADARVAIQTIRGVGYMLVATP